jgi:hypothetical protein
MATGLRREHAAKASSIDPEALSSGLWRHDSTENINSGQKNVYLFMSSNLAVRVDDHRWRCYHLTTMRVAMFGMQAQCQLEKLAPAAASALENRQVKKGKPRLGGGGRPGGSLLSTECARQSL